MTLRFAVGAEEEHTNNAVGMGWTNSSGITITNSAQGVNTGNQAYFLSLAHSGASQNPFILGPQSVGGRFAAPSLYGTTAPIL
ncbi:hypothetical protein LCGC14_2706720 [marine sediment metagenome]|uniref:Uncharacterized protein n=1 Tax=marine sediment metagenome TaxID=412755 RepID=A0A0F9BN81_9ZZZZ